MILIGAMSQDRQSKHTIILHCLFVAFTASDAIFHALGLFHLLLNGNEPACTLLRVGSFELVGMATGLEWECNGAFLGNISNIRLPNLGQWLSPSDDAKMSYHHDQSGRSSLVFSTFGQEKNTLASFLCPSSIVMCHIGLLVSDVRCQMLRL